MKLIEGTGFVLKRIAYGETSLIVTLYTDTLGKISFMVKGVKKGNRGRYYPSYFEPLNLLHFFARLYPHRDLHYFHEVELEKVCNFNSPSKRIIGGVTCDLFYTIVKEEMSPEERYFHFLTTYTEYIEQWKEASLNQMLVEHFERFWIYLPYLAGFSSLSLVQEFKWEREKPIQVRIEKWLEWCQKHIPLFQTPMSMGFLLQLAQEDKKM